MKPSKARGYSRWNNYGAYREIGRMIPPGPAPVLPGSNVGGLRTERKTMSSQALQGGAYLPKDEGQKENFEDKILRVTNELKQDMILKRQELRSSQALQGGAYLPKDEGQKENFEDKILRVTNELKQDMILKRQELR
nr:hypothetical protein Iba_chr08dCG4750 [Ipomoea batatas]